MQSANFNLFIYRSYFTKTDYLGNQVESPRIQAPPYPELAREAARRNAKTFWGQFASVAIHGTRNYLEH